MITHHQPTTLFPKIYGQKYLCAELQIWEYADAEVEGVHKSTLNLVRLGTDTSVSREQ